MSEDMNAEALTAAQKVFQDTGMLDAAIQAYLQTNIDKQVNTLCDAKRKRAEKYFAFEENQRGQQEMQEVFLLQQMQAKVVFMEKMAHRYYLQLKELGVLAP